jgi:hypothetical protein
MGRNKQKFLVWLKVGVQNSVINERYAKKLFEEKFGVRLKELEFLDMLYSL